MIFLDTSYFKGLSDKKDSHHSEALNIKDEINSLNEKTVINTTVLVETLNRTAKRDILANNVYDDLRSKHQIVSLTKQDYLKSLEINTWYGNSINFNDCIIINTMLIMNIQDIVTFDSDFKKIKGFNILTYI